MSAKLLKSTAVTGGMTLVSRISGLVRDILFARLLGASAGISADAFYVAFAIPNFFRRIFGEGAFSQAFVPVMSEHRAGGDEAATRAFVSHMSAIFGLILLLVTVIGVVAAPLLVWALAPGFAEHPDKFDLTVAMLRVTFPYLMFISLVAMAAGILNAHGRFAAAAFTPVLLNVALIVGAAWVAPRTSQPVMALAWAVFAAGVIQLLFQLPFLKQLRMLTWPRWGHHESVSRVFRLMLPAIFGSSVSQINMLVNRLLASFLATGSVSWLYFSDRLMEFPLGIFGIALATVILPALSRQHSRAEGESFSHLLDWALRWVFVIAVPATIGLVVLARPMLTTMFLYEKFNVYDVEMAGQALMAFAIGLPAFILIKVLAPGFYARQDTMTPARIAVVAFVFNIALSVALVFPLKHVGLALAISLAAMLNAGLLYYRLRQQGIYRPNHGWSLFFLRVAGAAALMAVALAVWLEPQAIWTQAGVGERIMRLTLWIGAGILIYVTSLWVLGLRLRHLRNLGATPEG